MLTEVQVRSAKPGASPRKLFDARGLYLHVMPNGGKYWRFNFRFKGKYKTLSLGVYPDVPLARARERHQNARQLLADKVDPCVEKKASSYTFEAAAREWHEHWKAGRHERHAHYVLKRLEADVFPEIGSLPLEDLSASDFRDAVLKIERRGALDIAKRVLQTCGQIMRYSVAHDFAKHNPVGGVKPSDILKPHKRRNFPRVDAKELPALLHAIDNYVGAEHTRLALQLMALTFVRTSELIGARWSEFDIEAARWDIPGERMKMKTPHIVALSTQSLAVLEKLREISFDRELVFPGDLKPGRQGEEPAWPAFDEGEIRGRGRRRGVRIGVPRVPERPPREVSRRFVNHQEAALWLSALASRAEGDKAWMEAVETTYAPWTFAANGAGLQEDQEIEAPQEWNAAFFSVMTANFRGKKINEIESALEPLFKLQDEAFFDLTEMVLYKVDALYFNEGAIAADTAVEIRKHFALRLSQSYGFQRLRTEKSTGVEVHLGPAIATVFFNLRGFGEPPRLYLPAGLIQRSLPFLPVLQPLAEQAPGVFVAMCAMNWVEAAPTTEHLRFVVSFAMAAIAARRDDKVFWSDYGIAARICNWLTRRLDADETSFGTTSPERRAIDELLAKFVTMGISEARRLEIRLQATS